VSQNPENKFQYILLQCTSQILKYVVIHKKRGSTFVIITLEKKLV